MVRYERWLRATSALGAQWWRVGIPYCERLRTIMGVLHTWAVSLRGLETPIVHWLIASVPGSVGSDLPVSTILALY